MCRQLRRLVSFVLVLGVAGNASAELVGHWRFDEGSGTIANDASGNGNDGTLNGDPQWVVGHFGGALEFDGTDDWIDCGSDSSLDLTTWTVAFWLNVNQNKDFNGFVIKGLDAAENFTFRVLEQRRGDNHRDVTTLFGNNIGGRIDERFSMFHGPSEGAVPFAHIGSKNLPAKFADSLFTSYPGDHFGGTVERGYAPLMIHREHPIGDAFKNNLRNMVRNLIMPIVFHRARHMIHRLWIFRRLIRKRPMLKIISSAKSFRTGMVFPIPKAPWRMSAP